MTTFWSEEDGSFMADVTELSGCAADGKTYQKALSDVEVVIDEWIETCKLESGISHSRREN